MRPVPLAGLGDLADRYDVLLCDVWGVIHNGREAFEGPCASLARWCAEVGPVVLISNSPRPAPEVARQLDDLGVARAAWSALVTSGDVTREILRERAPGPAWHIGPQRDETLFAGLGLAFSGPKSAAFIACTGLEDDEVESPQDYRPALAGAAARGLEMICANPDKVVQRGDVLVWCAGALAEVYESLGGAVVMAGKPFAPIYALSLQRAGEALGGGAEPARVLAIGDGIATDIVGANRAGLDALFICSGIHAAETADAGCGVDPDLVRALLAARGASAQYVMAELAWSGGAGADRL